MAIIAALPYDFNDDAAAGVPISSVEMMINLNTLLDATNNKIDKDGSVASAANQPMGGFNHTGVADSASLTSYPSSKQIVNGSLVSGVTTGTAPNFVSSLTINPVAYAFGQHFTLKMNAASVGSDTLNINSLGAIAILVDGAATTSTSWGANDLVNFYYDGTQFQAQTLKSGASPIGKQTVDLPASALVPRQSSGCSSLQTISGGASNPDVFVLDFDASTAEYAQFQISAFPKSWNGGTVTARFIWMNSAGGSGNVIWGIAGAAISSADDYVGATFGTAVTTTSAAGTAGYLIYSSETSAITLSGSPAKQDSAVFRFYRDAAAGGDTYGSDARLIAVQLFFTTDAGNDA